MERCIFPSLCLIPPYSTFLACRGHHRQEVFGSKEALVHR